MTTTPEPQRGDDGPLFADYSPIERLDTLVMCGRCGAVVPGDVISQTVHNVWHRAMEETASDATTAKTRHNVYGGSG